MASSATSPKAARVFAGPATNCCWNHSWRAWSCAATGGSSRRRVFRRFSRRCSRNTGCPTTNSASTMSTCRANTACRPATAITTCTTGWPSRKAWSTTSASTNTATPWSAATGSTSRSVSPAARYCSAPSRRATTHSRCFILSATAKMFVRLDRPSGTTASSARPTTRSIISLARRSSIRARPTSATTTPVATSGAAPAGLSAKAASEGTGAMRGWHRSAATTRG